MVSDQETFQLIEYKKIDGKEVSKINTYSKEQSAITNTINPPKKISVKLFRKISRNDMKDLEIAISPGFEMKWRYDGINSTEINGTYLDDKDVNLFVRNSFI